MTSALATFYPSRFAGFAFLAFGYMVPNPEFEVDKFYGAMKEIVGYDCFGYWQCVSIISASIEPDLTYGWTVFSSRTVPTRSLRTT
jgi:hypothetical protein